MEEKIICSGEFDFKKITFFKDIMTIVTLLSNAIFFIVIAFLSFEYNSYYGRYDRYNSAFEYMFEDLYFIFIIFIAIDLVLILLSVLPFGIMTRGSIILTDTRVYGINPIGKESYSFRLEEIQSLTQTKDRIRIKAGKKVRTIYCLKNAQTIQQTYESIFKDP